MSQYQTQRNRLLQKGYFGFKPEEAAAVVAHAYAHQCLDIDTWRLMSPIDGLQDISSPEAILRLDPAQQMTELVRMVVNLQLAGISALLNGNEPRDIVATMFGFTNFEALSDYARMDPVDPILQIQRCWINSKPAMDTRLPQEQSSAATGTPIP